MEYIEDKDKLINAIKNDYSFIFKLDNIEKNDPDLLYYAVISYLDNELDDVIKKNLLEFLKRFSDNLLNNYEGDFFKDFKANYKDSIFTLPHDDFIKVLDLFNKDNITLDKININNYMEASLQEKFNKEYNGALTIHKNILESVRLGHKAEVNSYLKSIKNIYNYDSLLESVGYTNETFLKELNKTTGKAKSILKQICDRFLDKLRTNYLNENKDKVLKELELEKFYDKNKLVNKVINDLTYNDFINFIINNNILEANYFKESCLDKEIRKFVTNGLSDVLNGKKNHIATYDKKDLRLFSILITYLYDNHYLEKMVDTKGIPVTKEEYPKLSNADTLDIIYKLDKKIIEQDLVSLNKFLSDTKILGLGKGFNKIFDEVSVNVNNDILANILSNYNGIVANNPKNIFEYFKYSLNLGSSNIKLRMLFLNDEAYMAYILNKPPYNNIEISNKERMESIYDLAKELFNRKELTIPPIDKDYHVNGHKYHVTIGNFNDFSQLALGELTSSCVRNGSIFANDLYKYALFNKNGFNIIIRENDRVVGKVSGFRNGNTLILNQLRENFYPEVNNLIEVMKKVSSDLVSLSRKKDPIKNVVIGNGSCMQKEKTRDLKKDLDKLFNNMDRIYCDIDYTKACLLTSHVYPFDFHYVHDTYPALRDEIKCETDKSKMNMIINHYILLKFLLKGKEPNEIYLEDIDVNNIDELYYGHDFYVVFKDGKVTDYLIYDNSSKAIVEIASILESKQQKVIKK